MKTFLILFVVSNHLISCQNTLSNNIVKSENLGEVVHIKKKSDDSDTIFPENIEKRKNKANSKFKFSTLKSLFSILVPILIPKSANANSSYHENTMNPMMNPKLHMIEGFVTKCSSKKSNNTDFISMAYMKDDIPHIYYKFNCFEECGLDNIFIDSLECIFEGSEIKNIDIYGCNQKINLTENSLFCLEEYNKTKKFLKVEFIKGCDELTFSIPNSKYVRQDSNIYISLDTDFSYCASPVKFECNEKKISNSLICNNTKIDYNITEIAKHKDELSNIGLYYLWIWGGLVFCLMFIIFNWFMYVTRCKKINPYSINNLNSRIKT